MGIALSTISNSQTPFKGGDNTQKVRRVYFQVTPSGNYPGTPGDPMDFTTLGEEPHSGYAPIIVFMVSAKSGGTSGYTYAYSPGNPSSQTNGFFQVLVNAAATNPDGDLGAGAYPAGVLADTILGYADFIRL